MAAIIVPAVSGGSPNELVLRAATAAYLGRYRDQTRVHSESDLRVFLRWCTDQDLEPLAAVRVDIERYLRWLQDVREHQPSTVSRRLSLWSASIGSASSTASCPTHPPLLGLLGLGIFETCAASISDLGEEHGHRVLRVRGKGGKVVLIPLPPAVARAIERAIDGRTDGPILRSSLGARMDRHAATRRLKHLASTAGVRMPRMHPHMLRHTFVTTMLDAGVSLRDVQIAARHADPRTTMRYDRARNNLDRHPNYILAAYMASGT